MMSSINYDERKLQRALEQWQPAFLDWWRDVGPQVFKTDEIYLRTAISTEPGGWAQFGHVRMPDYRWGIFLADREKDRKITCGDDAGKDVWQSVPGEYRNMLKRIIVVQADTEPASVEHGRAQPLPGQCGGRPPPLGHGLPAACTLRSGWPGRGR
jgi:benzoyl-CoA 2,3-dioxygenase component B